MTHNAHRTERSIRRDMNLALDHALPDSAEAALHAHLSSAPGDAALWERLRAVDGLLRSEPMVQAPPDFASKVMASIAAGAATSKAPARRLARLGSALEPLLAVGIVIPLAAAAVIAILHWLSDPAALNNLMQQIVLALNTVAQAAASLFQALANFLTGNAVLPALLTTIIPLIMIWGWFMWYTAQRRRLVVYRIPVRVIA
jgi:anti-sigma factor RsiW